MTKQGKHHKRLSEEEIDQLVITEAEDDSAWEPAEPVTRIAVSAVSLPQDLAARAAFFARLHRRPNVDEWLAGIIRERIELEEAVFAATKKELAHALR